MASKNSDPGHETSIAAEGSFARSVEEARRLHHLATADPERDGTLTGPAHEEKYGLERAEGSAAAWRAAGVHPTENRALVDGEDGAENLASTGVPFVGENERAPEPEGA